MTYRVHGPTPDHPTNCYASVEVAVIEALRRIRVRARVTLEGDVMADMGLGYERLTSIETALDRFLVTFEGVRITTDEGRGPT